ncbi:MAG: hypothetical protein K9L30_18375 [Desulfobacterales bacterium]|nr:hypothetical protein [Desulfobacterales bacterium]
MSLENKIALLNKIYDLYDETVASFDVACRHFCAYCCTRNLTMTSLEGYLIFSNISKSDVDKVINASDIKRFTPKITTNGIAEYCIEGKVLPEEETADPSWGSCPILTDSACPYYDARPFGCRCFMSKVNCGETGFADVDPLVITLNNVFQQYIEHIDSQGFFGNFSDIIIFFSIQKNLDAYASGRLNSPTDSLITNRPAKSLLVPPEHREKTMSIIRALNHI